MGAMTEAEMMARVPERAVGSETTGEGRVVLLRPKFLSPRMGWFQKLLPRPFFRVRLDATGSFIWEALDGKRTVREVCAAVRERFGAGAEPVEERTVALVVQMVSGGFVRLL